MSKHGALIGSSERRGPKPIHPDWERWIVSLLGFALVVVAWAGGPIAWWFARHNAFVARHVQAHLRLLHLMNQGFGYAALAVLGITLLGLLWTLLVWVRWQRAVRRVHGDYLQLVTPRPTGREGTPRTTPDAPSALVGPTHRDAAQRIAARSAALSRDRTLGRRQWARAVGHLAAGAYARPA